MWDPRPCLRLSRWRRFNMQRFLRARCFCILDRDERHTLVKRLAHVGRPWLLLYRIDSHISRHRG